MKKLFISQPMRGKTNEEIMAVREKAIESAERELGEKVELGGTFCMGKCQQGVCVTVDEAFYSVTPETVTDFFKNEVLAKV